MHDINPETAAHNIAKIFCEQHFKEISAKALKKRQIEIASKTRNTPGDPDVAVVKAISNAYAYAYDIALNEIECHSNTFRDLE